MTIETSKRKRIEVKLDVFCFTIILPSKLNFQTVIQSPSPQKSGSVRFQTTKME